MTDRKKFLKYGIVHKFNFLSLKDKKLIKTNFKTILAHYLNLKHNFVSFENKKLHQELIKMRETSPVKFGNLYDTLNLSSGLKKIFYQDKFLKLFSKILGAKVYNVFINGFMFRLDVPYDKRNVLDWHQDSPYYEMTHPKFNSGVCWLSITKNTLENGSLNYLMKSHQRGHLSSKGYKLNSLYSEQHKIKIPNDAKVDILRGGFGDISCLHMNMIHKSGNNISNKIRMSIGCRFHEIDKKFNIGKEVYLFNKTRKTKLF